MLNCEDSETLEWVARAAVDGPTLTVFKARLDWIFEQRGLVEGMPVHGTRAIAR